jgi:hypothetical protein
MKAGQMVPYVLPSQTYSAGSRTTQTLRDLPKQYLGKLAHLVKFTFGASFTPTHTTAPSTVGNNNLITACDFWDGSFMRFQGGFNHLRFKEHLQTGRYRLPDADTDTASGTARYYRRVMHVGPPQFEGAPSDFAIPTGMLENGELRFTHGALTDLSADTTAASGTVRVVAWLLLLDEIRIPPAYQFINQSANAADINLAGRAMYTEIALLDSGSFGNWGNGELGNIRLDLGQGDVVPSVNHADLLAGFHDDFATGHHPGATNGAGEAASDDNAKIVNSGTPTALTGAGRELAPVLWSPPGSRIQKCYVAESVARLRWDGTQASAIVLIGRILPQPSSVIATAVGKAVGRLGLTPGKPRIKTASKNEYKNDKAEFMPWKIPVNGR